LIADLQRQADLIAWYRLHHRQLPWRTAPGEARPDGYSVAVSELMLQQTRVDTVIDYFKRWKTRWPGWPELAAADLDEVLGQWTGLGYYNRARNLHRAAQIIVADHAGHLPQDAAQLAALPGLGPYTVGAVRSLAFGLPAPLVDGNVVRVLARWHAWPQPPAELSKKLWEQAAIELNAPGPARSDPPSWNQALMELGATVCTPKKPQCPSCPVATACLARAQGLQESIPPAKIRTASPDVQARYAVVLRPAGEGAELGCADATSDLVLLGQRPATGRWAGLWEPPGQEGDLQPLAAWIAQTDLQRLRELPPLQHVLTHRNYLVDSAVFACPPGEIDLTPLGYVAARWLPLGLALGQTAGLSRLGQRLLEATLAAPQGEVPTKRRRGRPPKQPPEQLPLLDA
jgi:A/G-specific adenine glycosylase